MINSEKCGRGGPDPGTGVGCNPRLPPDEPDDHKTEQRRSDTERPERRDRLADHVQHHLFHGVGEQRIANALDHDCETEGGYKVRHIRRSTIPVTLLTRAWRVTRTGIVEVAEELAVR